MSDVQRLSEHILLGDVIAARDGRLFYSDIGRCGCALGRAMVSVGAWAVDRNHPAAVASILAQWPWLSKHCSDAPVKNLSSVFASQIGGLFNRVCREEMTIEQLAQKVREWEDLYDDRLKPQVAEVSEVSEPTQEKKEEVHA
jgi:hypothetical protein